MEIRVIYAICVYLGCFLIINALENKIEKPESLCISLGFNCEPALSLNRDKLRTQAFPFDWNITSLHGLCDIIGNDFLDFLNPFYFDRRAGIFNTKYNMAFAHDFPVVDVGDGTHTEVANYLDFLEEIQIKYQRRIERFYDACSLADKIYFFRLKTSHWKFDTCPQDKISVIKLRNVLMKKFPTDNWTLVVIADSAEYAYDWEIPRVKNFYISASKLNHEWTEIFKKLGLLK